VAENVATTTSFLRYYYDQLLYLQNYYSFKLLLLVNYTDAMIVIIILLTVANYNKQPDFSSFLFTLNMSSLVDYQHGGLVVVEGAKSPFVL